MSMTCKTCRHVDVALINAALVAKVPFRTIADRFEIGILSLKRHTAEHIPELLAKATEAEEILQADRILADAQRRRVRGD